MILRHTLSQWSKYFANVFTVYNPSFYRHKHGRISSLFLERIVSDIWGDS